MLLIANILIGIVALLHAGFLVLEMFLWNTAYGRRVFGLTTAFAAASRTLAANQGLYNGFLAAGLAWGSWLGVAGASVKFFFLACVIVAGVYGGVTVNRRIFFVQAVPAILAAACLFLS